VSRWKILILGLAVIGVCVGLLVHRRDHSIDTDESTVQIAPTLSPSEISKDSGGAPFPSSPLVEKKEETLKKIFPDTETGRSLAKVTALFGLGSLPETHPQEAGRMAAELASLRNHPDQTVADLREGLKTLPGEYAPERQFLLQFVSRLNADRSAITDMLSDEMKTPVKLPQDKSLPLPFYTPATALDAMIDVGIEPSKIKQALMDALAAQTDPAAQLMLIGRYERVDRPGAAKLMEAYRASNNP
jgi:hypothetical protein